MALTRVAASAAMQSRQAAQTCLRIASMSIATLRCRVHRPRSAVNASAPLRHPSMIELVGFSKAVTTSPNDRLGCSTRLASTDATTANTDNGESQSDAVLAQTDHGEDIDSNTAGDDTIAHTILSPDQVPAVVAETAAEVLGTTPGTPLDAIVLDKLADKFNLLVELEQRVGLPLRNNALEGIFTAQDAADYFSQPEEEFIDPADKRMFSSLDFGSLPSNLTVELPETKAETPWQHKYVVK